MITKYGKVSLVGAGPGDAELLTIKALRAIEAAQAVVYDRLVSEPVLALIPKTAQRYFAGKSCKQKAMTQDEINALLISLARQGLKVVRLKGGDPFLFGRGGEEALALAEQHIPFEIIPGITSAQGCAAYAGIPLTHRTLATGVRFLTGHRMSGEEAAEPLALDWRSLADSDTTLVVYMGLANLGIITTRLTEHGLPADTPAAAISHGTTPQQNVVLSSLHSLERDVRQADLRAPVLVIIGNVAALAAQTAWFQPENIENADESLPIFTELSH